MDARDGLSRYVVFVPQLIPSGIKIGSTRNVWRQMSDPVLHTRLSYRDAVRAAGGVPVEARGELHRRLRALWHGPKSIDHHSSPIAEQVDLSYPIFMPSSPVNAHPLTRHGRPLPYRLSAGAFLLSRHLGHR